MFDLICSTAMSAKVAMQMSVAGFFPVIVLYRIMLLELKHGVDWFIGDLAFLCFLLIALCSAFAGCVIAVVRRSSSVSFFVISFALASTTIAMSCQMMIARDVALMRFVVSSQEVVVAMNEYFEAYNEVPPNVSDAFGPGNPSEPRTGFAPCQEYRVLRDEAYGDPWGLEVIVSNSPFGGARLLYLPSRQYPEKIHKAVVSRIGEWALIMGGD
jgi:hypothetical protein